MRAKWSGYFFLLLLLGFVFFVSLWGLDLGRHWDESAFTLPLLKKAVATGVILPGAYTYPSLWYHLALSALIPDAVKYVVQHIATFSLNDETVRNVRQFLIEAVSGKEFHLRTRALFAFVSLLSVIWVYLAVFFWRRDWREAIIAAAILGLSWEIGYHIRWVSPHGLSMQFGALTMLFLVLAWQARNFIIARAWIFVAAISAGLMTGAKYPSGLMIVPVFLAAYFIFKKYGYWNKKACWQFMLLLLIFACAYLFTTPGTILDPVRFLGDVVYDARIYATNPGAYRVNSPLEHFSLTAQYLGLVLFSAYWPIALFFFAFALFGMYAFIKEGRETALVFLSFPALYLLFIVSLKTMYVRNLLELVPFLAIFSARGMSFVERTYLKENIHRLIFTILIAVLFLTNVWWLFTAADSVRNRNTANYVAQLAQYLDKNAGTQFVVSEPVLRELTAFDKKVRQNVNGRVASSTEFAVFRAFELAFDKKTRDEVTRGATTTITQAALYAFEHNLESKEWRRWTANRFNYTERWFGPYEVNFNYYPGWVGNDRIVVMPIKSGLRLGIFD